MKKSFSNFILFTGALFTFFSCQKVNEVKQDEVGDKRKLKKDFCLISSFSFSNPSVPTQTIFTNHYDLAGRSMEVEAGVYSGGSVLSTLTFNVKWTGSAIAFLSAGSTSDTILLATINKKGRVDKIIPGNTPNFQFLPTTFDYNKDGLSAMHITLAGNVETSYFVFDTKGNILSINDEPTTSVPIPGKVEYEYAPNEKASQQFYFDEPRGFSWNSFSLLQYIGLFPELQPVNLRKSTKVTWGMNYQAYHMNIANQQVDQAGRLVSYDIVSPTSGNAVSHYNINWTCNLSENSITQGLN